MTVYRHDSGERVQPVPGSVEHARLADSPHWHPEDTAPVDAPIPDDPTFDDDIGG